MNIVEVQDNLKNFSQEQLVSEINKPSGMVPQFLVLTELGRRNRMKQDIEGRQAQNQPTVAQEVVSAAGVPQGGIMDMARSMAPKSSIEQNDGVEMMEKGGKPSRNRMDMLLAYLRSIGADEEEEVREATGGKSIAEMINFGGDYRPVEKKADGGVVKMATAGSPTREVVYEGQRYLTDGSGRVFKASRRGSMRRGQEVTNPEIVNAVLNTGPSIMSEVGGIGDISSNALNFDPTNNINQFSMPEGGIFGSPASVLDDNQNIEFPPQTDASTQKAISEIAGLGDNNFQTAIAKSAELEEAAANREKSFLNNTPPKEILPFNQLPSTQTRNETLLQDMIANSQRLVPGGNIPRQQTFSSNQPQVQEELIKEIKKAPDYNFSNDPTKGYSDPGGGLESYFGTTESIKNDPYNLKNIIKAASQTSNADDFTQNVQSLARSKAELEGGIPSDELSFEPFNNQPIPPFLPSGSEDTPDELMVPFDNTPSKGKGGDGGGDGGGTKGGSAISSLESEIANMLKENEEDREQDKYLALAKMGLALMSSSNPTFGGALGEAGMAGVEDLQASRKSYRADKITLLDAQRKLEQARATAAGKDKSGLTGTNIISRLNNIQTRRSSLLQEIAKLENPTTPYIDNSEEAVRKRNESIEPLRREAARLGVEEKKFESLLGGIGSLGVDLNATTAN